MIQEIRKPIQDLLVCCEYQDYGLATGSWHERKERRERVIGYDGVQAFVLLEI